MKTKKIVTLLIVFVFFVSMFCMETSAAEIDTWGPQTYTPYTGRMGAFTSEVVATGLKWTSSQVQVWQSAQQGSTFTLVTEYEFRPNNGHPIDYWYEPTSSDFLSNYPSAYYEFESGTSDGDNDVAVCCGYAAGFDSSTSYYGVLMLDRKSTADFSNNTLQLESEYGMYFAGDALPMRYEIYKYNAQFGQSYTW